MGHAFNGCGLELGRGMGKVGGRSKEGAGKPHLFKSDDTSLFCQRRKHLSQLQFHLNWFALALYIYIPHSTLQIYGEACHSGDTKGHKGCSRGRQKKCQAPKEILKTHLSIWRKNPGLNWSNSYPKGNRIFPGAWLSLIYNLPAPPTTHMHTSYLEFSLKSHPFPSLPGNP